MNILDLDDLPQKSPSAYSVYKRIAILLGLIVGLAICLNLWLLNKEHAQNWHDNQSNQLGRSLIQHTAKVLASPMTANDSALIQQILDFTLADSHVIEAVVFDSMGKPLAELTKPDSILNIQATSETQPLVFIEEIVSQDQILGYLRLQLTQDQVMRFHDDYQKQLLEQSQALMLLAFLAGGVLIRAFYKWRIKRYLQAEKG